MNSNNSNTNILSNYKHLFQRSKNLLISPIKEWKVIFDEKLDFNKIISDFTLPYIAVITLIVFLGSLSTHQTIDFTLALKTAVAKFSALFIGLLLSYFITLKTIPGFIQKPKSNNIKLIAIKITAYSSIILYLIQITIALIPQLYFLIGISLYTGYLVWLATDFIGEFETKDLRIVFTIIVSLLLLLIPYLISIIFIQFSGI